MPQDRAHVLLRPPVLVDQEKVPPLLSFADLYVCVGPACELCGSAGRVPCGSLTVLTFVYLLSTKLDFTRFPFAALSCRGPANPKSKTNAAILKFIRNLPLPRILQAQQNVVRCRMYRQLNNHTRKVFALQPRFQRRPYRSRSQA
ncbi:hypothetical protein LshimejAT787_0906100 [Lyophyllum shimeji]|uniref:Uncharacterized protein n=1 Tax=Lyophyllum shimeji TaxID=47721 RepID=A0A9P3URJ2_LYOSH|nr:hypothetical protein LshimejAT787_0906100 [Lyophyllum shimeji]